MSTVSALYIHCQYVDNTYSLSKKLHICKNSGNATVTKMEANAVKRHDEVTASSGINTPIGNI